MKRRDFLKAAAISTSIPLVPGCLESARRSSGKKPNIIFIFADQLRSHAIGCYGNDQLSTPHIDRLAKEGVKFTNAISTAPVCGPFRGMLMTGNFPMKNGMVLTDHFLRNPTPYFAQACKSAGYRTGYIGKWHLDGYDRGGISRLSGGSALNTGVRWSVHIHTSSRNTIIRMRKSLAHGRVTTRLPKPVRHVNISPTASPIHSVFSCPGAHRMILTSRLLNI